MPQFRRRYSEFSLLNTKGILCRPSDPTLSRPRSCVANGRSGVTSSPANKKSVERTAGEDSRSSGNTGDGSDNVVNFTKQVSCSFRDGRSFGREGVRL